MSERTRLALLEAIRDATREEEILDALKAHEKSEAKAVIEMTTIECVMRDRVERRALVEEAFANAQRVDYDADGSSAFVTSAAEFLREKGLSLSRAFLHLSSFV